MAQSKLGHTYARSAAADLSENLHRIAKVNGDGDIVLATAGDVAIGTIYEAAASGQPVTVQLDGIGKVVLGGTVTAGQAVASDGSGKGVTASGAAYAIGIALEGGAADEVVSIALQHSRAAA